VLEWLLESFPVTDREVSSVHAPFMLAYLINWINVRITWLAEEASELTVGRQNNAELVLSVAELDKLAHILMMLVTCISIDTDPVGEPSKSDGNISSIDQLATGAKEYYTSEAEMRPPPEPLFRPSDLIVVLFQNLTSSTSLKDLRRRLDQHHQLHLLQTLVKKLKAAGRQFTIEWERDDFLKWIASILKVFDSSAPIQGGSRDKS
jgi:hypothetical protein